MTDETPLPPSTPSSTKSPPPIDLRITGELAVLRNLSPDDVLVVMVARPISNEVAAVVQATLARELRHPESRILLLDSGLTLDVLPVRPRALPLSADLVTEDAAGVAALRTEVADVWKRLDAVLDEVCTTDAAVQQVRSTTDAAFAALRAEIKALAARA